MIAGIIFSHPLLPVIRLSLELGSRAIYVISGRSNATERNLAAHIASRM
jgi:hypothetical protein